MINIMDENEGLTAVHHFHPHHQHPKSLRHYQILLEQ